MGHGRVRTQCCTIFVFEGWSIAAACVAAAAGCARESLAVGCSADGGISQGGPCPEEAPRLPGGRQGGGWSVAGGRCADDRPSAARPRTSAAAAPRQCRSPPPRGACTIGRPRTCRRGSRSCCRRAASRKFTAPQCPLSICRRLAGRASAGTDRCTRTAVPAAPRPSPQGQLCDSRSSVSS